MGDDLPQPGYAERPEKGDSLHPSRETDSEKQVAMYLAACNRNRVNINKSK